MGLFRTWNRVPRSGGVAIEWQLLTPPVRGRAWVDQRVERFLFREKVDGSLPARTRQSPGLGWLSGRIGAGRWQ